MLNARECKIRTVTALSDIIYSLSCIFMYVCIYLYIVFEELKNFRAVIFHNSHMDYFYGTGLMLFFSFEYYRCHYEMLHGECCMGQKKITQECINNDKIYTSSLLKTTIVDRTVSFAEE